MTLNIEFDYEKTKDKIIHILNSHTLVLFMKGDILVPKWSYSRLVVEIFRFYGLTNYHSVNVLEQSDIRQGMKTFSSWPTFPQVYVDKQFVGGADVIKEMHADGTLEDLLLKHELIKSSN